MDFASWLAAELQGRGWNQAELVRRGKLAKAQVSRVLSRERPPTFAFCQGVAFALDMKETDVLQAAGLLDPATLTQKTGDSYIDRILRLLPLLSREDKEDLLALAESKLERRRGRGSRG